MEWSGHEKNVVCTPHVELSVNLDVRYDSDFFKISHMRSMSNTKQDELVHPAWHMIIPVHILLATRAGYSNLTPRRTSMSIMYTSSVYCTIDKRDL